MPRRKTWTVVLPDDPDSMFQRLVRLNPQTEPSEILTDTVARYLALIRRSLPDLSVPEWCCVVDALGKGWEGSEVRVLRVDAEVSAAMDERDLDRQWSVDGQRLRHRLSQLPFEGKQAVGEVTEMFWMANRDEGYTQVLIHILARLSTPPENPGPPLPLTPRLSADRMG